MAATDTTRTAQVLTAARATRKSITDLEVEQLTHALEWARLHPGDPVDESIPWGERDLQVAGDGAPTVAEFAIAEFALAIGLSTDAGFGYVGDAVELAHRLPRLWARVSAGQVPVWKARKVAQATKSLPMDAAGYVDRHLAPVAHRCSLAQVERSVEAARAEYDPADAEERRLAAAERRHFDVYLRHVTAEGLVYVDGLLDLADAVSLNKAITARAATLDPELPLDVRRAMAAGLLNTGDSTGTANGEVHRQVVVYTHTRPDTTMVEVENTRTTITPEQLREWCQVAGTEVTVRPVLDLNKELTTGSYTPTPRQREQAWLTHPTCVFPRCTRPSRGQDLDHITEWPTGATSSQNLAPLCRGHHRLKTHTAWTYQRTGPRTFTWTSPHGLTYDTESDRHLR
jgi:hypothetical protein